jgi:hypothetical protein
LYAASNATMTPISSLRKPLIAITRSKRVIALPEKYRERRLAGRPGM